MDVLWFIFFIMMFSITGFLLKLLFNLKMGSILLIVGACMTGWLLLAIYDPKISFNETWFKEKGGYKYGIYFPPGLGEKEEENE